MQHFPVAKAVFLPPHFTLTLTLSRAIKIRHLELSELFWLNYIVSRHFTNLNSLVLFWNVHVVTTFLILFAETT